MGSIPISGASFIVRERARCTRLTVNQYRVWFDSKPDSQVLLGYRLAWPKALVFEISIVGSNPTIPATVYRLKALVVKHPALTRTNRVQASVSLPSFMLHSTSGEVSTLSRWPEGIVTPMQYQVLSP